jgi:glycosyltransferase involved in cell wall biosynthesis
MKAAVRQAIFTICSNNYIPVARTFLTSARRHHPEADLFVCLADRRIDIPGLYDTDWTVVGAEELGIHNFRDFSFRYDIMELNTAVKPFMFRHLFDERCYDVALYFDPDIEIFRPLDGVVAKLCDGATFVMTPHLCAPSEGKSDPNDFTVMRAGTYNLGFLGVSRGAESERIIDWWARRLRFYCISAQEQGIFVDQKFMDLVPGFAPRTYVSPDITLNVAYWNVRQRPLEQAGEGWTVGGEKLTFFHYSGFDPRKPTQLSKYDPEMDGAMPEPLRRLTAGYAERLLANGYGTISGSTYAYGRFVSGTTIHPLVRQMYREWHKFWPDNPFETYEAFLDEPWPLAARQPGCNCYVTNFMKCLHSRFPGLWARLDLKHPASAKELIDWFVLFAGNDLRLDLRLIEPAAARLGMSHYASPRPVPASRSRGAEITVVGYLRTASGVGEVGRQTLLTLAAGGIAVEGHDVALNVTAKREDESCAALLRPRGSAPVQIFNINADQLAAVVAQTRATLPGDALRINIPFWELARFPAAWLPNFAEMDEIWAPSRFIQTALAGRVGKPLIHMPVAIELTPRPAFPRERFGLPTGRFLFFYAFDFLSFIERKNPHAVIAAFRAAFPRRGTAGLVLKCMNGARAPEQLATFQAAIGDDPDIFLVDATLSRSETLGLIAATDALVSLHRSEGLGLLIAEAMLLEKPVIATDYSASREFVSDTTGYPVGYELVPVCEGDYPFHEGQVWAAPDVAHAAWLMRRLCDDPVRAAPQVARAAYHLGKNHNRIAVARQQAARLHALAPSLVDEWS